MPVWVVISFLGAFVATPLSVVVLPGVDGGFSVEDPVCSVQPWVPLPDSAVQIVVVIFMHPKFQVSVAVKVLTLSGIGGDGAGGGGLIIIITNTTLWVGKIFMGTFKPVYISHENIPPNKPKLLHFAARTYLVLEPSLRVSLHMYCRMTSQWLFWSAQECWLVHSMGRMDPS